jgi:hypothetical protein
MITDEQIECLEEHLLYDEWWPFKEPILSEARNKRVASIRAALADAKKYRWYVNMMSDSGPITTDKFMWDVKLGRMTMDEAIVKAMESDP